MSHNFEAAHKLPSIEHIPEIYPPFKKPNE